MINLPKVWNRAGIELATPGSAVRLASVARHITDWCESDCRFRGREFDPGPVTYFGGEWSWHNFYCHSPPFLWIIQEGLLSVASESMCTKYWLTAWFPLIWYATWLLSEKRYSLTFWHHPLGRGCVCGQNICYHVAASAVSFNLICNMTTFRKR